jgi:hypothetical protein
MRGAQRMPGMNCGFRPREREAPKEPQLPAGAWALFLLSEVAASCECFHCFTAMRAKPGGPWIGGDCRL